MRSLISSFNHAAVRGRALLALAAAAFCSTAAPSYAKAPKGRYTINNGEVKDNKTGLIWRQELNPAAFTFTDAIAACTVLGNGWRTPNIRELFSLVDETSYGNADEDAFPGNPSAVMWSSTPEKGDANYAWTVQFGSGAIQHWPRTDSYQVRCVR